MGGTLGRFLGRVAEKAQDVGAAPVLVVAFGDSVTQGMTAYGEQTHDLVYHARFKRLLEEQFPNSTFSVINAGVSGENSAGALAHLERDVIRHQPDLTLVAYGLNDAWGGPAKVDEFIASLTRIVTRVRAETSSDVILLTPSFMNKGDNPNIHAVHRDLTHNMAAIQNSGTLALYAEAIRGVAKAQGVACADVYRAWENLAAQGVNTDEMLSNGLNHPTAEAHALAAKALVQVVIDATASP